jgi:hypothetical protein
MSKSVRLKDHLVAEVERLANEERRSLAQMVELLLEQALKIDGEPRTKVTPHDFGGDVQITTTLRNERRSVQDDDHFKPDFGSKLK